MKKLRLRVLSIFVCVCMLLSMNPVGVSVFAAEDSQSNNTEDTNIEYSVDNDGQEEQEAPEPEQKVEKEQKPAAEEPSEKKAEPEKEKAEVKKEVKKNITSTLKAEAEDGAVIKIKGELPEGASVKVEALELSKKKIAEYTGVPAVSDLDQCKAYDISILDKAGKEIEPDDSVEVTVKKLGLDLSEGILVSHVTGKKKSERIHADTGFGKVEFTAESFSTYIFYTVDFMYGNVGFSIDGESEVTLETVFESLKIERDIDDVVNVEFSDEELVKVEQVEGEYVLRSLKPFTTEEVLTVTFNDESVIEIAVTDATVVTYTSGSYGGAGEGAYTSGAEAIIDGNVIWNLSAAQTVPKITFNPGATLTINTDSNLTINNSAVMTIGADNKLIINNFSEGAAANITSTKAITVDGGEFKVTTGGAVTLSAGITNKGTVNINAGNTVKIFATNHNSVVQESGSFKIVQTNNAAAVSITERLTVNGGTIDFNSAGSYSQGAGSYGFTFNGTTADIKAGTSVDVSSTTSNSGTLTVTAGTTATFSGAVTNSGALSATSSGNMTFGNAVTQTAGEINVKTTEGSNANISFSNSKAVNINAGSITVTSDGSTTLSGTFTFAGTNAVIDAGTTATFTGTVTNSGALSVTSNGKMRFGNGVTQTAGSITAKQNSGEAVVSFENDSVKVSGGTFDIVSAKNVTFTSASPISLSGSSKMNIKAEDGLTASGNFTSTDTSEFKFEGKGAVQPGNTVTAGGAKYEILTNGTVTYPHGFFAKAGTATIDTDANVAFTNTDSDHQLQVSGSAELIIDGKTGVSCKYAQFYDSSKTTVITDGDFTCGGHFTANGTATVKTYVGGNESYSSTVNISGSAQVTSDIGGSLTITNALSVSGGEYNAEAGGDATFSSTVNTSGTAKAEIKADGNVKFNNTITTGNTGSFNLSFGGDVTCVVKDAVRLNDKSSIAFKAFGGKEHSFSYYTNDCTFAANTTADNSFEISGTDKDKIIIDLGAIWTGTVDEDLGRGTTNSSGKYYGTFFSGKGNVKLQNVVFRNGFKSRGEGSTLFMNYTGGGTVTMDDVTFKDLQYVQTSSEGFYNFMKFDATEAAPGVVNLKNVNVEGCYIEDNNGQCTLFGINNYIALNIGEINGIDGMNAHNNKFEYSKYTAKTAFNMNSGLIYVANATDSVNVMNSTFTNNYTNLSASVITIVGADAKFSNTVFDGNESRLIANKDQRFTSSGGTMRIVANKDGQNVTFSDGCEIKNGKAAAEGGAISIFGYNATTSAKLNLYLGNTLITGNEAILGGAMFVEPTYATDICIEGGIFKNNSADALGGAVYIPSNSTAAFTGTEFNGNTAGNNGGAISAACDIDITDCYFIGNSADKLGGAVASNKSIDLLRGEMMNNSAALGGALYTAGAATVSETVITGNSAAGLPDAPMTANAASITKGAGGGIYAKSGSLSVEGTKANIHSNSAELAGNDILALSGVNTAIEEVAGKMLAGTDKTAISWYEDYVTGDGQYDKGLMNGESGIRYSDAVAEGTTSAAVTGAVSSDKYVALVLGTELSTSEFTVYYYYEDQLDESKTYTGSGIIGNQITSVKAKTKGGKYVIDENKTNLPFTVKTDSSENIIKVYYKLKEGEEDSSVGTDKTLTKTENGYNLELSAYVKGENVSVESSVPSDVVVIVDQSGSMNEAVSDWTAKTNSEMLQIDIDTNGEITENAKARGYYRVEGINGESTKGWLQYVEGDALPWKIFTSTADNATPAKQYASLACDYPNQYSFIKTRSGALDEALTNFTNELAKDAVEKGVDHRISVVGYCGGSSGVMVGSSYITSPTAATCAASMQSIINDYDSVIQSVNSVRHRTGGSDSNEGWTTAKTVYNNVTKTATVDGQTVDRSRYVIFFADSAFEGYSASAKIAKTFKNGTYGTDSGTKEPLISIFGVVCNVASVDKDGSSMNKLTSNYDADLNPVSNDYHYAATSSEGMIELFEKISSIVQRGSINLTAASKLVDTLTDEFEFKATIPEHVTDGIYSGDEIKVYTEDCKGFDISGNPTFENRQELSGATVKVDTARKKIEVTGFDYSECYVKEDRNPLSAGKRIVVEFPIVASDPNAGILGAYTNDYENSGIYTEDNDPVADFPEPRTDLPAQLTVNKVVVNEGQDVADSFDFDIEYQKFGTVSVDSADEKYLSASKSSETADITVETTSAVEGQNGTGSQTIDNIYPDGNIKISEDLSGKKQYKIDTVTYTSDETTTPTEVEAEADGSYLIPAEPGITVTVTNKLNLRDLTIHKTVPENEVYDEHDSFVFHVTSTMGTDMYVTTRSNDSVTIHDLPVGVYNVDEVESWSWRYKAVDKDQSVNLATLQDVYFVNNIENHYWLSGSNWCINRHDTVKSIPTSD